jgi:hypothetical protein
MQDLFKRLLLAALLLPVMTALAQETVDRIAARVENDIILLSDVRELGRYQLFVDGKAQTDDQILERLIDQWIVRNEATISRIAQPSNEDVERSIERLKHSFGSPEEFENRRKQSGLSNDDIRRMQKSQLYLSNYLDTRFRPTIRVDDKAIEDFYQTRVISRAQSRGETPPTLDEARDYIQEVLVQGAINEQADKWLKESRSRVRVEKMLTESPQ